MSTRITLNDLQGMVELAKTNKAMQDILEQAKVIYELAKPPEDPAANKIKTTAQMAEMLKAYNSYNSYTKKEKYYT